MEDIIKLWNYILLLFVFALLSAQGRGQPAERLRLANEMEQSLRKELLAPWYPRAVDTISGGFLTTFTYDFKPTGPQDKMIVTQSRHVWTNSKAALRYPTVAYYKQSARHGYHFLRDFMWDKVIGAFYTMLDRS